MILAMIAGAVWVLTLTLYVGGRALLRYIASQTEQMRLMCVAQDEYMKGPRGAFEERMRHLEDMVEMLPQRWDQIRKEAERLDGRARSAVKRVSEELEERGFSDDTIESLAHELRLSDGERGEESELYPVPAELAGAPEHAPQMTWQDEILAQIASKTRL